MLACVLLLAACGDGASRRVMLRFDPTLAPVPSEAETWLAFPFPSDHRRHPDGSPDLSTFPNPKRNAQIDEWIAESDATIDGASTQGLVYLAFDGDLDPSSLPASPDAFMDEDSPILLVDITPASPELGRRFPLRSQYWPLATVPDSLFVAKHMLGVGPAWGFPLREGTTYALVLRDSIRAVDGTRVAQHPLVRALLADDESIPDVSPPVDRALYDELRIEWAPLRASLVASAIDPKSVVGATVFTTQTFTHALDSVASVVAAGSPPTRNGGFVPRPGPLAYDTTFFQWSSTESVSYATYRGAYLAPNFQEGTIPYDSTGGALHFVDGVPTPVFVERLDFVLTVPSTPPDPARGCYPIVMYGHGTGGDRESFRYDGTAGRLAARGMAGISIDMPMHGGRAQGMTFDVDLKTFNLFNASSFRSNFRQGAIDLFSLTRFVRESLAVSPSESHTGQAFSFCADHVGYMGHSQGALTGALALPFLPDVGTFMLSGGGGGFGISLLERKDIADFSVLLQLVFAIPEEEEWSENHPLISFIQSLADVSDPSAYARYWNVDATYRTPASVMSTSGLHDEATPYRTALALAVAARMPVTMPVVLPVPEYDWLAIPYAGTPLAANVNGATMGLLQFTDDLPIADADTHFLVFERPEAIDASMHFLATGTSASGNAEIRRMPTADAR